MSVVVVCPLVGIARILPVILRSAFRIVIALSGILKILD